MMDTYNWDNPCKLYSLRLIQSVKPIGLQSRIHQQGEEFTVLYNGTAVMESMQVLGQFADDYNLTHGDVLRAGDFRDCVSFIVNRNTGNGQYEIIRNPNETGAGYLTIPYKVMRTVSDTRSKFADVLRKTPGTVNFHVSPQDKIITDKLGQVSHDWRFDVHFIGGRLEEFWVSTPECDWQRFVYDKTNQNQVFTYFQETRFAYAEFVVDIDLKGKDFRKYQDCFKDLCCLKDGWKNAIPRLPALWTVRKTSAWHGLHKASWKWVCRGPKDQLDKAMTVMQLFLTDFPYKITISPHGQSYFTKTGKTKSHYISKMVCNAKKCI